MLIFLIKVSVCSIAFLCYYKLFLEKESFYTINRYFLLICLFLSFTLPTIDIPKIFNDQGIVEKYASGYLKADVSLVSNRNNNTNKSSGIVSGIGDGEMPNLFIYKRPKSDAFTIYNLVIYFTSVYVFGILVFLSLLITQLSCIAFRIWKCSDKIRDGKYIIVNIETDIEPSSFFNFIFINPSKYDYETYFQILTHEQTHVDQKHSMDILIAEIAVILLWFNPFIWIFRNEIEQNIEYQTDDLVLDIEDIKAENYQLNLINVASCQKPMRITTNYNQSLIKKRILKMTSQRSTLFSLWKYAFVIPLIFVCILFVNESDAKSKNDYTNLSSNNKTIDSSKKNIVNEESPSGGIGSEMEMEVLRLQNNINANINHTNIDSSDIEIIRELTALGDNEAKQIIANLSDIRFDINYSSSGELPAKTFVVMFKDMTLLERLEVMQTLKIFNALEEEKRVEIYHILSKYDLEKPDVLEVLNGHLKLNQMEGRTKYKLRTFYED